MNERLVIEKGERETDLCTGNIPSYLFLFINGTVEA